MRDKKGTHRFWGVLFYLALMVTIVSASYAGVRFCSNLVTEQSYERLRDAAEAFAVGTKNGQQGKEKNKAAKGMERESEAGDDRPEGIDFAELSSINPDIYAWIRIPDTQIDYPVLQREEDDTYYLRHNSSGRYAFAGSIYTEEANSRDFKDPMTVLYGHNMRDGSMFQNLHFFEDKTFFAEHPEFFIYLPGYRLTYEIFAAYRFDDTHLLGAFDFSKKKGRRAYIREVFAGISMGQNTREDVKVTAKDKLVTLSTCTSDQADGRYLVQAVLKKKKNQAVKKRKKVWEYADGKKSGQGDAKCGGRSGDHSGNRGTFSGISHEGKRGTVSQCGGGNGKSAGRKAKRRRQGKDRMRTGKGGHISGREVCVQRRAGVDPFSWGR